MARPCIHGNFSKEVIEPIAKKVFPGLSLRQASRRIIASEAAKILMANGGKNRFPWLLCENARHVPISVLCQLAYFATASLIELADEVEMSHAKGMTVKEIEIRLINRKEWI